MFYAAFFLLAAALRACLESERFEAALFPSRFSALLVARDRFAEGLRRLPDCPFE